MAIAVLYPRFDHPAIEERYAAWQTQMRLRSGADHGEFEYYDPHEGAAGVMADVHESDNGCEALSSRAERRPRSR
jgi:hypothetical protein